MSDTFDWQRVIPALGGESDGMRLRLGTVVSVQNDRTITVTIAGSTTQVTGVKYLAHVQPDPGEPVWLMTDGKDLFAFAVLAAADRTFAPRAYRTTAQNIANNNLTVAVQFSAVSSDSWGAWSSGANTRLTARLTGRYIAMGQVLWAASANGIRGLTIQRNGSTNLGVDYRPTFNALWGPHQQVTTTPFDMTAGTDYIEMLAYQNSGGGLNIENDGLFGISMGLIYLGP